MLIDNRELKVRKQARQNRNSPPNRRTAHRGTLVGVSTPPLFAHSFVAVEDAGDSFSVVAPGETVAGTGPAAVDESACSREPSRRGVSTYRQRHGVAELVGAAARSAVAEVGRGVVVLGQPPLAEAESVVMWGVSGFLR